MKKALFTLSIIFLLTGACSAQRFFVGGSVNMSTGVDVTRRGGETTNNQTSNSIAFGPRFGFFVNEKLAIGLSFEVGIANTKNKTNPDFIVTNRSYNLAFAPYVRYTYVEWGRFALMSESSIWIGGGGSSITSGDNTGNIAKTFNLGIGVVPVVAFRLTEKIDLETTLDFVGLSYNFVSATTPVNGMTINTVTTTSDLVFGANSNNVFNTGDISVGFIYKF